MTTIIEQDPRRMQIEAIVRGDHDNPFGILGMHGPEEGGAIVVRTFQPRATAVSVVNTRTGEVSGNLTRVHPDGFFEGVVGRGLRFPYRLRVTTPDGSHDIEDPYRFPPVLGDMDTHLLAEGTHHRLYDALGAHPKVVDGVSGTAFAVWAPNARRVSVVGPFNQWDGRVHPMRLRYECAVWELFIPGVEPGALYKYELKSQAGELLPLKADPVAFQAERPPATASIVADIGKFQWGDHDFLRQRMERNDRHAPISTYEVHLGSWRRRLDEGGRYLSYRELADQLVPYVRDLGFTHIELMPVSEYPFDGSWGYQPTGLYAPTSRYGTPDDFHVFVDRCHQEGIGVIVDWVAGHFPTDAHGLAMFDGTHLYEHADPRQGRHRDWDTLIYNYGRREVANYLIANALFWVDRYHLDGLRVDAVASMLYLDYSRKADDWIPNRFGGRENLEAIDFLRRTNEAVYGRGDGATTIAEESTAWPSVSRPTYLGGLGFGFKWNMGWMHDTLLYMSKEPIHRRFHHNQLTFGLIYAFSENFVLPLSHDEVVHGKGSLINKMPGDDWQKFANLRAYYGFMWTMPGKKLLFMGGEFAQWHEWNHDQGLDWQLLDEPRHRGVQSLVRDLNRVYREEPSLHQLDCEPEGFDWIDGNDADQSVLSYIRYSRNPRRVSIVVCNFTPMVRQDYRIGVPQGGFYRERMNTDATEYGGSGVGNAGGKLAEQTVCHGKPFSLSITLPPLATVIFTLED
jgi:1,4-alpha-glucan branching enzyme